MYAIIDIETTGGNSRWEKITEIAVFVHDGEKVIREFTSLINPEKIIPEYISKLTGITNQMVEHAPKFFEVAKEIVEITKGCVFVAHNVGFDYNFVREEFKSLGYDYRRKKLCTVRLSRKLLPGHRSYSLGKLCNDLDIQIEGRHRAGGDALATVKLFEILLQADGAKTHIENKREQSLIGLHPQLDVKQIDNLPEEPGVYYFYNEQMVPIYIGKSKNIRERVLTHLQNGSESRKNKMKAQIAEIGFEVTGSELVALLKESGEIKKHRPYFNRAQKRTRFNFAIVANYTIEGYVQLNIEKVNETGIPLMVYATKNEARQALDRMVNQFNLCQKLAGLYESFDTCFRYRIHKCRGACCGEEEPSTYNRRAAEAIEKLKVSNDSFLVIDSGATTDVKSVVWVDKGKYRGFGQVDMDTFSGDIDALKESIEPQQDNRDVRHIINAYLRKHRVEQLIRLLPDDERDTKFS